MLESAGRRADKPLEGDNKKRMKVTESSSPANSGISGVAAGVTPGATTRSARPQPGADTAPQTELSLTAAAQAAFAGRPERVAQLRNLVSSGSYSPQTQGATEKMIDGALSRPE